MRRQIVFLVVCAIASKNLLAETTINLSERTPFFIVWNQGTNNAKLDTKMSSQQSVSGPFQLVATPQPTSTGMRLWYAVCSAYVGVTAYMEYMIFSLEHGAIAPLLEGKEDSEIVLADVCVQYGAESNVQDDMFAFYTQLQRERTYVLQLQTVLSWIPGKLFPRYQYARAVIRRYKKPLDLLFSQMSSKQPRLKDQSCPQDI